MDDPARASPEELDTLLARRLRLARQGHVQAQYQAAVLLQARATRDLGSPKRRVRQRAEKDEDEALRWLRQVASGSSVASAAVEAAAQLEKKVVCRRAIPVVRHQGRLLDCVPDLAQQEAKVRGFDPRRAPAAA